MAIPLKTFIRALSGGMKGVNRRRCRAHRHIRMGAGVAMSRGREGRF